MSELDKVVRLSIHFHSFKEMEDWVEEVRKTGAFGTEPNDLVPTVEEPRKDIGIREFDGIDQRKTSAHYTLDHINECKPKGKTLMEVFKEDDEEPPLFV